MKLQSYTISKILKNYDLCDYCTGRIISKLAGKSSSKLLGKKYLEKFSKSSTNRCYICKNIFDDLNSMLSSIYEKSSGIDFKTFNLGLILKSSFLERDDYLKSKFKVKGIENIKFSISAELIKKNLSKDKFKKNCGRS